MVVGSVLEAWGESGCFSISGRIFSLACAAERGNSQAGRASIRIKLSNRKLREFFLMISLSTNKTYR
jgi:hypothetical protein